MKKLFILIIFIFQYFFSFSQNQQEFMKAEDSLVKLGKIIQEGHTDFIKYNASEKFFNLLQTTLFLDKSFDYPFDSLVSIAHLTAEDKKFRIFNWFIGKSDGTYEYFGIIQAWNDKENKYVLYNLKDNSDNIKNPETQLLEPQNWFGALYYKIIFNKYGGKKYYTLLGWDGNNYETQKKIIDVLTFTSKDKPVFGAPIFRYNKKNLKRMIFEYSSTVTMSLKFDKQYLLRGKKKRAMIVFDRVSPLDPALSDQFQFYYPETNIVDAFMFRNGKWNYMKEIDARNPKESKEERDNRKKVIKEQKEHFRK